MSDSGLVNLTLFDWNLFESKRFVGSHGLFSTYDKKVLSTKLIYFLEFLQLCWTFFFVEILAV